QQLPAQGRTTLGQHHRQALIPAQERKQPPQRQHRCLSLAAEQQVEAMAIIVGQGLAAQRLDALEIPAHQLDADARARRQHQSPPQAGIEQQRPALRPAGGQGAPGAQGQHPWAVGPGEGEGRLCRRGEQAAHGGGPGRQTLQQGRRLQGVPVGRGLGGSPAVAQPHL
ncbi:MAG: hypothetical protein ACK56I_11785, partial [bacterium]